MKSSSKKTNSSHNASSDAAATHAAATHASAAHTAHSAATHSPASQTSPESTLPTEAAPAVAAATTSAATSPVTTFLTAPPSDARSPSPPAGFEPPPGANFRGVTPRGTELAAAAAAIKDLQRFAATYTSVLGATAPPLDHLMAALVVASGWSGLRIESSAWDIYCATEEGMAWQAFRPMLDKLGTAFQLASDSNRALTSQFPGLATLLGSKSAIAKKGVSTKRLNKKAIAEGNPPYHGLVGKKRQRKAEKAAVAQQPAPPVATPPVAPTTGTPAQAPQGGGH